MSRMSRILFVVPPYSCWGVQVIGTWPPLQIAYLAAAAERAGHEARIYDAMSKGTGFDEIRAEIERFRPEAVVTFDYLPVTGAISTATVPAALQALRVAKEVDPRTVTIMGGPLPTFLFAEIFADAANRVDFVLRGEAEETLPELLGALRDGTPPDAVAGIAFVRGGGPVETPLRPHVADLDALRPAWHLLDWKDYHYNIEPWGRMASMLTSRGCMMACSFCSHRQFWRGDWRARSPENVIAEVRELVDVHRVQFITLIDPYPTHDRARWERLLDLLAAERLDVKFLMETRVEDVIRDEDLLPKYRRAGVIHLYLGAEGSTNEMLVQLNKGTSVDLNKRAVDLAREHDIMTEASFMIGGPTETWKTIDATIAEAIRVNPDIAVFPVLTPMPFTPIHQQFRDRIRVTDWSKYNLATPIVEPYEMTLEDVMVALGKCYMSFYARKMPEVLRLPDGFKRRYMLSAFQEMMKGYREHFSFLGLRMPTMRGAA